MTCFSSCLLAICAFSLLFCGHESPPVPVEATLDSPLSDSLLSQRFRPPAGFRRVSVPAHSFGQYLRNLPLKPPGSPVLYYDGDQKNGSDVYAAVVDLPIGKKNLHQCADAIIRLKAEYLWENRQYDQIRFHFTNGFVADYARWRKGERIKVVENQVFWENKAAVSDSYANFWAYLEKVFEYAGTWSLSKELQPKKIQDLQIGDVFIQGGSPGHAVLVVDLAENSQGERVFMLAQSYMPAQEIQILLNPLNSEISPWYSTNFGAKLYTPEWTFKSGDLKEF